MQQRIRKWDCDALLVVNPRDIRYLTGFIGDDSWALVRARSGKVIILSDSRFDEQIDGEAPHAVKVMRKAGLPDAIEKVAKQRKISVLALQSAYTTTSLRKAIGRKLGARNIKDVDDGLLEQRAIKDEAEVKLIRKAGRIQQQAFEETIAEVEPGQSEAQICALLEYNIRRLGADGVSFPSIVAVDANSALPHAIPGNKKVRRNSMILIDWGAKFGGYCSDMTRVVTMGKMAPKIREIYRIVLDAQLAAIDAITPGKSLKQIDAVARDLIKDAGYGEQFGHGLGHGIGLDIHEQPVLSFRADGELQPGHVVTVEPGIYLPGVGGVRIEDDVLVTDKGRRVLTDLPKDLDSAMIRA